MSTVVSSQRNRTAVASGPRRLAACSLLFIASLFMPKVGLAEFNATSQGNARADDAIQRSISRICDFRNDLQDGGPPSCRWKDRQQTFLAQYLSNVCYTPVNWCYVPQYAPIGSPCWCATPYGPAGGYIR
jgi:hypothetical protein